MGHCQGLEDGLGRSYSWTQPSPPSDDICLKDTVESPKRVHGSSRDLRSVQAGLPAKPTRIPGKIMKSTGVRTQVSETTIQVLELQARQ